MLLPFSVPVYQPSPYTYVGREFNQLPIVAQHYLAAVAQLMPPIAYNPDPEAIPNQRWFLAEALFRALQGIDIALVNRRLEAHHASREALLSPSSVDFEEAAKQEKRRISESDNGTLDEFVLKFDALVWLDVDGHEAFTQEDWQAFRDALLTPIMDETGRALRRHDEAMVKDYMERHVNEIKEQQQHVAPSPSKSDNWRAGPRTPKRGVRSFLPRHPDLSRTTHMAKAQTMGRFGM
ncbi:hypothetical protein BU15DRAFT_60754 [Melanogaster broomeanus]|nr:hypothetical protein BU15DRAFT_60754 [Melanogaster broomeanus]